MCVCVYLYRIIRPWSKIWKDTNWFVNIVWQICRPKPIPSPLSMSTFHPGITMWHSLGLRDISRILLVVLSHFLFLDWDVGLLWAAAAAISRPGRKRWKTVSSRVFLELIIRRKVNTFCFTHSKCVSILSYIQDIFGYECARRVMDKSRYRKANIRQPKKSCIWSHIIIYLCSSVYVLIYI